MKVGYFPRVGPKFIMENIKAGELETAQANKIKYTLPYGVDDKEMTIRACYPVEVDMIIIDLYTESPTVFIVFKKTLHYGCVRGISGPLVVYIQASGYVKMLGGEIDKSLWSMYEESRMQGILSPSARGLSVDTMARNEQ
jgi:hypothetical protein